MTHLPSKGKGFSSPESTVSGKDDLRIIICHIVVNLLKIQKEVQTSEQRWIFEWNIKITFNPTVSQGRGKVQNIFKDIFKFWALLQDALNVKSIRVLKRRINGDCAFQG